MRLAMERFLPRWWLSLWLAMNASLAMAQPAASPLIWEHFFSDECDFLKGNISRHLPLSKLPEGGIFMQLEIYGTNTPRLVVPNSRRCTVPESNLYRVKTSRGQNLDLLFTPEEEAEKEEDGDDEVEEKKKKRQGGVKCAFPAGAQLSLRSGYGFVSCQADLESVISARKAWLEMVREEEERAHKVKVNILAGIGGGMTALVLCCAVCVLVRLRTNKADPRRSRPRHLTPARSVNTKITYDRTSSTHQSTVSSR